jgi:RND family efflux transporter MFP subunit
VFDRESFSMKPPLKYLLITFALLSGAAIVGLFLDRPSEPQTIEEQPVLTVRAIRPREQLWPRQLKAVGSVAPWQEVVISPEIGGQRLERLLVEAGDRVVRGQLLAQLASGTLEAQVRISRAALQEAEVVAAQTAQAAERAKVMGEKQLLSAQDLEAALAMADAAQARLAAARAQLEADNLQLSFSQIRAPDDGVISARSGVEGALVAAGQEILRLQRQGRLEWRAQLPGEELALIDQGQEVWLTLAQNRLKGRVRLVSPQVDSESRRGLVYVDLEPHPALRAGLFARGEFLLGQERQLSLPETAILLRDGFSYVFCLEGDRVRQQKVSLGARRADSVAIVAGLDESALVVESGVGFLADGVRVKLAGFPLAATGELEQ